MRITLFGHPEAGTKSSKTEFAIKALPIVCFLLTRQKMMYLCSNLSGSENIKKLTGTRLASE